MTTPNIEVLRGLAEAWRDYKVNNLGSTAEHIGMLFTHKRNFEKATTPDAIIALLDALTAQAKRIKELEERDEAWRVAAVQQLRQENLLSDECETLRAQAAQEVIHKTDLEIRVDQFLEKLLPQAAQPVVDKEKLSD